MPEHIKASSRDLGVGLALDFLHLILKAFPQDTGVVVHQARQTD